MKTLMISARYFAFAALCIMAGLGIAYADAPSGAKAAQVSFTLDFPGSTPDHYVLTVDSSGQATYTSGKPAAAAAKPKPPANGGDDSDSDSETSPASDVYTYRFKLSDTTRARIFDLAKRANYFKGDLDYGKGKVASTGAKTLTYTDGLHTTQATYNYSNKAAVEELTRLFQGMGATLEFGRRLDYLHRYQKLALDDELKRMEEMENTGQLDELQSVAPILKRIADDSTVMNVSRARAERLLAKAGNLQATSNKH